MNLVRSAAAVAFIAASGPLTGCSSLGLGSWGNDSQELNRAPFVAPSDPFMGQLVLSVSEVDVSAPGGHHCGDLGQSIRTQLANTLALSPNFLIADREALGDIAAEHRLAEGGAMPRTSAPQRGAIVGAQYLVKADVTEFQEAVVGKSGGNRFELGGILDVVGGMFGGRKTKNAFRAASAANPTFGSGSETVKGTVGIDVRVLDVDTGLIVASTRAQASLTKKNTKSVIGVAGFSTTSTEFDDSVLAQATRAAVEDLVTKVHHALKTRTTGAAPPLNTTPAYASTGN